TSSKRPPPWRVLPGRRLRDRHAKTQETEDLPMNERQPKDGKTRLRGSRKIPPGERTPARRGPGARGYLHGDGLLHRLDPRAKVLAAIVALVAILGVDSWAGYAVMAILLLT